MGWFRFWKSIDQSYLEFTLDILNQSAIQFETSYKTSNLVRAEVVKLVTQVQWENKNKHYQIDILDYQSQLFRWTTELAQQSNMNAGGAGLT